MFRKIIRSGWKTVCLILGSTLALGVIVSIPLFANGILQRTLTRDLTRHQLETGLFPGNVNLSTQVSKDEKIREHQILQLAEIAESIPSRLGIPLITSVHTIQFESLHFIRGDEPRSNILCRFIFKDGLENHINIIQGRMFNTESDPESNVIEVIVTEATLHTYMLIPGDVYSISNGNFMTNATEQIRVVGVFEPNSEDAFWQSVIYNNAFFLPYESHSNFSGHLFSEVMRSLYEFVFDYRQIGIEHTAHIYNAYMNLRQDVAANFDVFTQTPLQSTFISIIERFANREENLRLLLQLLNVPILIMLFYYIFMIAKLKIVSEEPFIAVIRSRGASGLQIFLLYLFEAMVIGIVALLVGFPLGIGMCRILGSSNNFLDFVSRAALPLKISADVYIYSAVAFLCIVTAAVIPALAYSRTSIVEQKRKAARPKKPLWKLLYLDVIMLGLSLYYVSVLNEQTEFYQSIGLSGTDVAMYIPLYLASTVFTIGAGLCFLRLYPWFVTLIYMIGRRFWTPATYAALHTIKRSGGTGNFVMLFIIMALSIGLFNAGAARTINRNLEDRIHSAVGSDIVTRQHWMELEESGRPYMHPVGIFGPNIRVSEGPVIYSEPPFMDFRRINGVDSVARVMHNDDIVFRHAGRYANVTLIAIDPYDFALTSWWRPDLAPYSINELMNMMMDYPSTVLLSESLRDIMRLNEGEKIRIDDVHRNRAVDFDVLAFIDYWPSVFPFVENSTGELVRNHFIIANLDYIFSQVPKFPYDVWIRKSPGVSDAEIYQQLGEMSMPFKWIETVTRPLVDAKNDPLIQGTNGALSLGFIIAMIICGMGFLVYWILSINSRMLQFGIMRAMGMKRRKILRMLIYEQLLVSGSALLFGIIAGNIAVLTYVPIFSLLYSGSDNNIPFRIFLSNEDSTRIYIIFGIVLICCLLILGNMVRRIEVAKVLKFGED